ncbi:hypothetical protein C8J56DRAFT_1166619 [Mycena floridula]|nr:hypothetical protein C8J56DRAFT_1166619 [Mycena floridula]
MDISSLIYTVNDVTLQATILEVFFFGLYTVIVALTLWGLQSRRRGDGNASWMTAVTLLMYLLSTVHVALSWYLLRQGFIVNGSTFLTAGEAIIEQSEWFRVTGATIFAINTLIADCTFIWRCWVVWGKNWWIIVLPVLLTVIGTVFSALALWQKAIPLGSSSKLIQLGTPYFAMSLVTTGLVTVLIIFRIVVMSPNFPGDDGMDATRSKIWNWRTRYSSVIEVVVESAALYSVALLVFLVLFTNDSTEWFIYPEQILGVLTGMAPTLIMARVSFGLARPQSSWDTGHLSTMLQFSPPQASNATDIPGEEDQNIESDIEIATEKRLADVV